MGRMPLSPTLTVLTCFSCGATFDAETLQSRCRACGMPLRVDLTLPVAAPADLIHTDDFSMWRYAGVLPVPRNDAISLVEGFTPLIELDERTWIKDESRNPTGSSKARGMSMAVSAAVLLGAERLVASVAGSAAVALSAYGAAAGIPVRVAIPDDTPRTFADECRRYGAEVDSPTNSDARVSVAARPGEREVDVSTMNEPFRVEGEKTMAYEIFEQFHGDMPDVVVYPTGGGTGLVGMWKAWDEMERMGWIGEHRPRLVSVQASGCAPIVRGFDAGAENTESWDEAMTTAYDLRVAQPIGGFLCLQAIRETAGTAVAIPDQEMHDMASRLAAATGVDICTEGGAAWAATVRLRASGWLEEDERVVLFNTGSWLEGR